MYSKFSFIKYQGNQKSYSRKHAMGKTTEKKCLKKHLTQKLKNLTKTDLHMQKIFVFVTRHLEVSGSKLCLAVQ